MGHSRGFRRRLRLHDRSDHDLGAQRRPAQVRNSRDDEGVQVDPATREERQQPGRLLRCYVAL
ncbi:hypothetical protein C8P66_11324 [Humitalea rosea]|uniref:Uncharacterized protein n=1 Tax=Humitalea rosea TaxID=990373 RepID=A0A2W7IZR3_9PROT|nr:hypothetical protein [Humitalea rosea]PZW44857.1 hypothetical protein C8P66_11324 [Humitalea rosea]